MLELNLKTVKWNKALHVRMELKKETLPFDTLTELRSKMIKTVPTLGKIDEVTQAEWGVFGKTGPMSDDIFVNPIRNFFMTDPISRASKTMAASTKQKIKDKEARENHD